MPSLHILPVLLVTSNILSSIDGALVLPILKYIKDLIISLIEVILGFLILIFMFRLFILLSTKSEELIILPFEVNINEKTYNGKIISEHLIIELRKIQNIHNRKFEEEDLISENIYLPKLAPDTENFETKVSNLGNVNVAGMTLSMGGLLTVLKRLWPLGGQVRTIKGSLQEYNSEIHLVALMEGPSVHEWDISCKIEQPTDGGKIPELIKDLAFMITYDFSKEETRKTEETKKTEEITAKTWTSLKYFTGALDFYSQYVATKKLEYLENTRKNCIKSLQEEKDYQILFNLFYSLGLSYYNTLDYYYAEDAFRNCITLKPNNEKGFIGLGLVLDSLDRHDEALEAHKEALKACEKALEANPKNAHAWFYKGVALGTLGRSEEALEAYEKMMEINPNRANSWFNKGNILRNLDRYEDALEAFEKALEISPNNADAWNNTGVILGKLGRNESALKSFDKALEINPKDADAWFGKGFILSRLNQNEGALKAYDKSLEINSRSADAWFGKGFILGSLGNNEDALKAFDKGLEIDSNKEDVWYNKGIILDRLGQNDNALKAYNKSLEINPKGPDVWYKKGNALFNLGQSREALNAYEKTLEINPEYVNAWNAKGNAFYDLGQHQDALKSFEKALEIDPEDADAWSNKGSALINLGRYKEALEAYKKALKIKPESAQAWYIRACVYSLINMKDEALEDLKHAVELNPVYREKAKSDKNFEDFWEDEHFKEIVRADEAD